MGPQQAQVRLIQHRGGGDPLLIYDTERGTKVELPYKGETLWATQKQMADMFGVQVPAISKHLKNIFTEGELDATQVISNMEITAADGTTYPTLTYNLNAMISVGYRIESKQGTMFRIWATDKIVQILTKGFYVDTERLKDPADHDHFAELRRIIQDIRSTEANIYAELKRILRMCSDYDPKKSVDFFATFQNKLHFAVVGSTAARIVLDRANADRSNMGLTNWPKDEIRKQDTEIAKNYLHETDMQGLNRATNMLLDYFEDQVERERLVSTADAEAWLDKWLRNNDRPVLRGKGDASHKAAKDHAHRQFEIFKERRRVECKKQADAELAALQAEVKKLPAPRKKKSG